MNQQEWIQEFERLNGRKPSPQEFNAAVQAGIISTNTPTTHPTYKTSNQFWLIGVLGLLLATGIAFFFGLSINNQQNQTALLSSLENTTVTQDEKAMTSSSPTTTTISSTETTTTTTTATTQATTVATTQAPSNDVTVAQVEAFWNTYIDAINNSISSGSNQTGHLWAGSQPHHIQEMINDYINDGVYQSKGNRTYTILNQDANTVTVSLNGTRTFVLQKTGGSFKILAFNF